MQTAKVSATAHVLWDYTLIFQKRLLSKPWRLGHSSGRRKCCSVPIIDAAFPRCKVMSIRWRKNAADLGSPNKAAVLLPNSPTKEMASNTTLCVGYLCIIYSTPTLSCHYNVPFYQPWNNIISHILLPMVMVNCAPQTLASVPNIVQGYLNTASDKMLTCVLYCLRDAQEILYNLSNALKYTNTVCL